jgi:hypothetical protein
VKVGPRKISWRLNARATVTIVCEHIQRFGSARGVAGKAVRKNQKAGRSVFRFNGRFGKRKLRPGKYRVTLVAKNAAGSSKKVRKTLRIPRR